MKPLIATALLVSSFLFTGACASSAPPPRDAPLPEQQLVRAVSPPGRLQPPERLPPTALVILKHHMISHARNMSELMTSVIVLDYAAIHNAAYAVADDANLSRPLTADATELNSALPESFFDYQDQLRREARTLAAAADRLSPTDVASAYGRLSEGCIRCHAAYRAGK